jgi:hypothetical protein
MMALIYQIRVYVNTTLYFSTTCEKQASRKKTKPANFMGGMACRRPQTQWRAAFTPLALTVGAIAVSFGSWRQ